MAIKIMLEIKGEMFDMWEFRSIQRGERYNDLREEMDYMLLINKNAIATNYNDLEIVFQTQEEREQCLKTIRACFDEEETVVIIPTGHTQIDH